MDAHILCQYYLLVVRGTRSRGFEFKYTAEPRTTRSMHTALADLALERLDVVHAGPHTFPLEDRVRAISFSRLLTDLKPLQPVPCG
jgi:hypothetical protein